MDKQKMLLRILSNPSFIKNKDIKEILLLIKMSCGEATNKSFLPTFENLLMKSDKEISLEECKKIMMELDIASEKIETKALYEKIKGEPYEI